MDNNEIEELIEKLIKLGLDEFANKDFVQDIVWKTIHLKEFLLAIKKIETEDLVNLCKGICRYETFSDFGFGSTTIIPRLLEVLDVRKYDKQEELINWLLSNRTNPYIPFGANVSTDIKTLKEYEASLIRAEEHRQEMLRLDQEKHKEAVERKKENYLKHENISKNKNNLYHKGKSEYINGQPTKDMKKILQFDDDEFLAKMYRKKLELEGFVAVWQEHPRVKKESDLIDFVLEIKPDLIIMDIIMPIMDGFKATEILKNDKRTKNIPIFMLTNLSQDDDIEKGKELGADDYFITSNHTPSEFISKIKEYLKDPKNYKPKFG
jgi:CheY-like chemotaxis protein